MESRSDPPLLAGRFRLGDKLGSGAFGEVYEAFDGGSDRRVALKLLRRLDPRSLYRFKREFRALAEITHDNVVQLEELFSADDLWFFTMERVFGKTFLDFVCEGKGHRLVETAATLSLSDVADDGTPKVYSGPRCVDEARLRAALRQLVRGVAALHRAGKLHRDIKPSNVLVTEGGRVVVLDFGMVAEVAEDGMYESVDQRVGTPAYMAPEQADGRAITTAADWYAVGVMLYQALTGALPHSGTAIQVLLQKQRGDGPDPRQVAPDAPAELAELCRDLLRLDPAARPDESGIMARLGAESPDGPLSGLRRADSQDIPLVGRDKHLLILDDALASTSKGRLTAVFVRGASGIGKSALLRRFCETARAQKDAIVLEGRCFERESVPYNALDAVVDALSSELERMDALTAAKLTPRYVPELCSVFPVLKRVRSLGEDAGVASRLADLQEVRQRAFAALKELLAKLAERRLVVVTIDDMQWGDVDSGVALTQLFDPPDPPALLFVGCHREDVADSGPLPAVLREYAERAQWLRVARLELEPLGPQEARDLAAAIAGSVADDAEALDAIVGEAAGHPYFVAELARLGSKKRGSTSLADLIRARVTSLDPKARDLLETIVIAGRPISAETAVAAADAADAAGITTLLDARLVRTASRNGREVETFHDRIRETVRSDLSKERIESLHTQIGRALEAAGGVPTHVLAQHYIEARVREKALAFSQQAADEAIRALAFDRAADLLRGAIDQLEEGAADRETRLSLLRKLADCLANARRGVEAADAYLQAARYDEAGALDLERQAATALFAAGHIDRGLAVGRVALARLGMGLPRSPTVAYWLALARLVLFFVRPLRFRERSESEIDQRTLQRMDTMLSLAMGLAATDTPRSVYFSMRYIAMAMSVGEPNRVGLAMMAAVMWLSAIVGASKRADAWQALLERLAERSGSPRLQGGADLADGVRHFFLGQWPKVRDKCARAERTLVEECEGAPWEISWARSFHCWSLFQLGHARELSMRAPALLEEGRRRDDLALWTRASTGASSVAWLVRDDAAGAKRVAQEALERWPANQPFAVIHHWLTVSWRFIYLYEGNPARLYEHFQKSWPDLRASGLLRLRFLRHLIVQARGIAALAYAEVLAPSAERQRVLRAALRDVHALPSLGIAGGEPLTEMVRAGVANLRGERDAAVTHLRNAEKGFGAASMALHEAAARVRLGALLKGDEGRALAESGNGFMRTESVVRPDRFTAMLAPGFDRD